MLFAFVLLSATALTACGGDDEDNPTGTNEPSTDPALHVILPTSSVTLRQGGSAQILVEVSRANCSCTVTITGDSLPSGVTTSTLTLSSGETAGMLTLTASANAPLEVNQFYVKSEAPGAEPKRNIISVSVMPPPGS